MKAAPAVVGGVVVVAITDALPIGVPVVVTVIGGVVYAINLLVLSLVLLML